MTTEEISTACGSWFETRERANGSAFVVCTDEAPELIRSAVFDVHMLTDSAPSDYVYALCARVVDGLCEMVQWHDNDFMSPDLWHAVADSCPAVSSYEIRQWFAEYPDAAGYLARACDEWGSSSAVTGDVHDDMARAWYLAAWEACAEFGPALAELAGQL